jgi:hypothetical protein
MRSSHRPILTDAGRQVVGILVFLFVVVLFLANIVLWGCV